MLECVNDVLWCLVDRRRLNGREMPDKQVSRLSVIRLNYVSEGRPCDRLLRRRDRISLVSVFLGYSGASIQIYYNRAKEFASQGCKVYATARNVEKMQALHHLQIELLSLDVTDNAAIGSVINTIIVNEGHIDIVVNNAGVGCYGVLAFAIRSFA